MTREKILHQETYKRGAMMLSGAALPTLYHTHKAKVISCEIQKAGRLGDVDGKRREFQILRIVLEPKE